MFIQNLLSTADMQRAHAHHKPGAVPPKLLSGSFLAVLQAVDLYAQDSVYPVAISIVDRSEREAVLLGLFYRSMGFARSAIELRSIVHQQSLTSAERSVLELYIDMALIAGGVIENATAKCLAFVRWQRLGAAKRVKRFYEENPALDSRPSRAATQIAFIKSDEAAISQLVNQLWGPLPPGKSFGLQHWSGASLPGRAKKLGKSFELMVLEGYDMRNFAVHTGLAGVVNMEPIHFEGMCAQAIQAISKCMLAELAILGAELDLTTKVPNYSQALLDLEEVQVYAYCDQVLRALGEPQRLWIHQANVPADAQNPATFRQL